MSAFPTRTVLVLLSGMSADPGLLGSALDRQEVLAAVAGMVGGIATASAVLQDKIYPPISARRRAGRDRRWRAAAAHLDHAALGALHGRQILAKAAGHSRRLIRDAEIVEYHGSLKPQHGRYRVDGPCTCPDCDNRSLTLQLQAVRSVHLLTCVNPSSISPAPALSTSVLANARQAERLLTTALDTLPVPLDAQLALYHARSLGVVVSRSRIVMTGWRDLFGRMYSRGWWSFDTEGGTAQHLERHIITTFDQAGNTLSDVAADLRRAVTVLAAIEADPAESRAA